MHRLVISASWMHPVFACVRFPDIFRRERIRSFGLVTNPSEQDRDNAHRAIGALWLDSKSIGGRPGELLRLLVLHQGEAVTKREIARLRTTCEKDVASKARYLRDQLKGLGCEGLLLTDRSVGYQLSLDGWQIDSQEFRSTIIETDGRVERDAARLVVDEATACSDVRLNDVLQHWHVNPGLGIPRFEREFDSLKKKAEELLAIARLCTRQAKEIREALQYLEDRSRTGADEFVWILLLLAYDAIGNVGLFGATLEKLFREYGGRLPIKIRNIVDDFKNNRVKNPFRMDEPLASSQPAILNSNLERINGDFGALHALCRTLGIASQAALNGSDLAPLACIRRTRRRLYFSGVLASKWVIEPAVRSELTTSLGDWTKTAATSGF